MVLAAYIHAHVHAYTDIHTHTACIYTHITIDSNKSRKALYNTICLKTTKLNMRFDVFIKNLTALELEANKFLTIVNSSKKFDYNARTSPHLQDEANQQTEIIEVVARLTTLHSGITSLLDEIASGQVGFHNTYDRSKWAQAIYSQEKREANAEKQRMNLTSEPDEINYLQDLNLKLKVRLHALEGEAKGKYIWINQNDDMIVDEPKGWNWGVIAHKQKYLDNIYKE